MSLLYMQPKVGFLHIPRTGGTWVEMASRHLGTRVRYWCQKDPKSLPVNHRLLCHPHIQRAQWRFAFVRHPIDYYKSAWKWIVTSQPKPMKYTWKWHPHMTAARIYVPGMPFAEWLSELLDAEPCWCTRLFESYVGPPGGEFVQFIGRTRTLVEDFVTVVRRMGFDDEDIIEAVRTTPPANAISMAADMPNDLRERVLREDRSIIARFWGPNTTERRWYARVDQA